MNDNLYQNAIVNKAREATGAGTLDNPDARVTVNNPVCGDRVIMEVEMTGNRVAAMAHNIRGCLLCQASAAVIGEKAPGSTRAEITAARDAATALVKDGVDVPAESWSELSIFQPVTDHKSRHYCVLLPFDALDKALDEAETKR